MAKVKLGNVSPRAIPRARGKLMFSDTKHGAVVSKWPAKRGRAKSGYDYYRQTEFGAIARWAASPLDLDLGTAIEMAKGTEQVPRDILQMAMMGLYYEIVAPDGTVWEAARLSTNPQYMLDLVTSTYGNMLWRDQIGWVGLGPGLPGQVLTTDGVRPYWWAGPSAPPLSAFATNPAAAASGSAFATKGLLLQPFVNMQLGTVYTAFAEVAGAAYQYSLCAVNNMNTIAAVVARTTAWTAASAGTRATPVAFATPAVMIAGNRYALLLTRTNGAANYVLPIAGSTANPAPMPLMNTLTPFTLASTLPVAGLPLNTPGGNGYNMNITYGVS